MGNRLGKYKVTKREFEEYNAKLDVSGGTVEGDLSIAGDVDILNTISASSGDFLIPGDLNFATVNGDDRTTIMRTTGIGSTLGIYNNLIYTDGTNLGVGTVTPS